MSELAENRADDQAPDNESGRSRGDILKALGAGAVGIAAGAALGAASDAHAADGQALTIGTTNQGNSQTRLDVTAPAGPQSAFEAALYVSATNPNAGEGVRGDSTNTGVLGSGAGTGVVGVGGPYGGFFSGASAALALDPQATPGPPTGTYFKGDMLVDSDGVLWLCIADGTPGTWVRVAPAGLQFLSSPQRVYDSRFDAPARKFNAGETQSVQITGVGGIPLNATAIVGNLVAAATEAAGHLIVWPTGQPQPNTANLNWTAPTNIGNSVSVKIGTGGRIDIYAFQRAYVILDVAAYVL